MPQHKVAIRDATGEELSLLNRCARMSGDELAWVALLPFGFAALGYALGIGVNYFVEVKWLKQTLACIGLVAGLPFAKSLYSYLRVSQKEARTDVADRVVEVIEVRDPIVVKQEEYNDEGPIYYVDIGDGKILFLWGQWMFDPHIFPNSTWHNADEETDSDTPFPFPTSRFVLHRARTSGTALRVELDGEACKTNSGNPNWIGSPRRVASFRDRRWDARRFACRHGESNRENPCLKRPQLLTQHSS